ncbi:MAG: ParA family protein [Defluviitaleaceae bacterium]|nr:ParA family protein [Defluviitaleaceae bacterium]
MKEIISIINQKGGVGKTTTAHALGSGMAARGNKVLFVDLDGQGNLSQTLNVENPKNSVLDVLLGKISAKDAISIIGTNALLASSPLLATSDTVIVEVGKEFRLKEALYTISDDYDYVILDTPPALGILTVNALAASTGVIIPAQADIYSLQGIDQLMGTVDIVKKYCNPELVIKGILLTRYNSRTVLTRDITEIIRYKAHELGAKFYSSPIRESISIKEAQVGRTSIFQYSPKSNATEDYEVFIKEVLED